MIVGISGKKGHGKDLLCRIIKLLTFCKNIGENYNNFLDGDKIFLTETMSEAFWKKKMFAEKLKQIICILTGCTMEQLEENFKII